MGLPPSRSAVSSGLVAGNLVEILADEGNSHAWAWFKSAAFWVTGSHGNRRSVRAEFAWKGVLCGKRSALPGSGLPGLKWPEAQQRQPVRMALAGHQFPRAFAVALGTSAAHETPMVQEEPQQAQI